MPGMRSALAAATGRVLALATAGSGVQDPHDSFQRAANVADRPPRSFALQCEICR
jgi:hypothetical protein